MAIDVTKYGLDMRCEMLLSDFVDRLPLYEEMRKAVEGILHDMAQINNIYLTGLETRVKSVDSLAGKLELKGHKYRSLFDLTDLVGARIITFYIDEIDKVAALVDKMFDIDWKNSVDKRKMHELNSFGYNSLHYICSIPKSLYFNEKYPEINEIRFELQMRSALQHVWATLNHDTGYKTGVEVPHEYLRNMNRLAGMLELADEQFSLIRTGINNYRRKVQSLVHDGDFDKVSLDGDTFKSYLLLKPFNKLNERIAALNQAEIHETSCMQYLAALKLIGMNTLGDIEKMKNRYSDYAYQLAAFQLATTDIDIISSTIALQNLCIVKLLCEDKGVLGLEIFFNYVYGEQPYNKERARHIFEQASQLEFMNK